MKNGAKLIICSATGYVDNSAGRDKAIRDALKSMLGLTNDYLSKQPVINESTISHNELMIYNMVPSFRALQLKKKENFSNPNEELRSMTGI